VPPGDEVRLNVGLVEMTRRCCCYCARGQRAMTVRWRERRTSRGRGGGT
jgi:hypothetical protein